MNWLERWAAGRLSVYIVDAQPQQRARLCDLLSAARLECTVFRDLHHAVAAMGAGRRDVPAVLVADLSGDRRWLDVARTRRPGLAIIGLSPLIRAVAGMHFAPLQGLLGADYLLPRPADPSELLATLVLAASEARDEDDEMVARAC